ncbi:MAG: lipocalin family protein [Flavobacteriales bacterium]|nr:lipocalin family protein [Flavobacteriales bacterium]MCB9191411.1 lipocalin family protein [Flavobacteriales bacterium]MCB9203963.1 lipocalin family protein [Flavobacteriales bacterium]
MKKLVFVALVAAVSSVVLSGCKEGIDKVLVGTWNVTEVQGVFNSGGNSAPPIIDSNPTGTITFRSNGTGEQNYSYTLGGTQYPQTGSFSWSASNSLIIIERVNDPDMEWTRVIDQENKQVATFNFLINANQSWDYTLTLEK